MNLADIRSKKDFRPLGCLFERILAVPVQTRLLSSEYFLRVEMSDKLVDSLVFAMCSLCI